MKFNYSINLFAKKSLAKNFNELETNWREIRKYLKMRFFIVSLNFIKIYKEYRKMSNIKNTSKE